MKYLRSMPLLFATVLFFFVIVKLLRLLRLEKLRKKAQILTYKLSSKIWRLKITQIGELADTPAMLVANHCSYVDVMVIGTLGEMQFTPKSEVRAWPLIGAVVAGFDSIFVDRNPSKANEVQANLQNAMQNGGRLCIFPEGTTNNGREIKPFKSSMFSLIAEQNNVTLQPIAVKYTAVDGQPMNDELWQQIGWFGDTELIPHMWNLGRFKSINVEVHCLPPISHQGVHRKELAILARNQIAEIVMG
jgi:lyso-ornithine lipid O-acyltransferase